MAWGNVTIVHSTECAGTSTEASQESFATGYNYSFTTSGTDVTVTFELLDAKEGVVAYAWTYNPNFAEVAMINTSGKIFSKTFTGQTPGATFNVACKFAFAGGMAVTKVFAYTVGAVCVADLEAPTAFTATKGTVTGTSVELLLNATDNSGAVVYTVSYGSGPTVLTTTGTSEVQKSYEVTGLDPSTEYSFSVVAKDAAGNAAANNPIVVPATTLADPNLLVGKNKVWSYNDTNTSLDGTGWNATGYNFSSWTTGQAPFGYANAYTSTYADIKTILTKGPGLKTAYFKTTFTIPEGTILANYDIAIDHLADDGILLYLNNASELSSYFTDFTKAPFASLPTTTISTPAWVLNAGPYPSTNLVVGANEISGIVKNVTASSSDLVFGIVMRLVPKDIQAPASFTATKGAVTYNSVELLLNATDDSGTIAYTISYGAGPTVLQASGTSGVQKSVIINGLDPSAEYNFSVVAKDAAGNAAANNPVVVNATTSEDLTIPTVAAPTPPAFSAPKVISIFSDAFTDLSGTLFNPNWGQSTQVATIQVAANNTLKYTNLNYQGTQFTTQNVATMKYLHVDVWTSNETSLQFFLISNAGGGEKFVELTPLVQNQWNSYEIPLTSYSSAGLNLTGIYQFKVVGSGGKVVCFDNLYFYDDSAEVDAEVPTAFTATKGIVASDAVELLLNATDNSGAISYAISYGDVPTVLTTTGVSGVQKSFIVTGLTESTEYSFSVTAKDATGNAAANSPVVVTATTLAPLPGAPVPTLNASRVISVFSNTYTNVAGTNFNPGWGQSTVATATALSGNDAMKYMNFGYQGIEMGSAVDASLLTTLHVDIFPVDETNIRITPISPGKEFSIVLTPLTAGQWNSFNIPLSSFTDVVLTNIIQFKLDGGTGKSFYMDNLYFSDDISTGLSGLEISKSINCYPNPFTNQLTVTANSEMTDVLVRNLLGQKVIAAKVNGLAKSIDLSSIVTGNYFITVKLANGQEITQKVIKL
jgi:hypothetical protein